MNEISKAMVKLHESRNSTFQELSQQAVSYGFPIIRPIWWEDPTDSQTYSIEDQFMLGDQVLVAPVLEPNVRQRDIYLPKGNWIDEQLGKFYVGPILIKNYSTPIDMLPHFRKGQCNPCTL